MTVVLNGMAELQDYVAGYGERFLGLRFEPYLRDVMVDLEQLHRQRFAAEQTPDGSPWPELSPATVERKGHDKILWETGRLLDSLGIETADSVREVVEEPAGVGLTYGTSVPYGRYHQLGEGVPLRVFFGVTEDEIKSMAERAGEHAAASLVLGDVANRG